MIIRSDEMRGLIAGRNGEPHTLLGMHSLADRPGFVIRAWDPTARNIQVVRADAPQTYDMTRLDSQGFFELHLPDVDIAFSYTLHSISR